MKIQVTPVGVVSRSCCSVGNAGTTRDWSMAYALPPTASTASTRPGRGAVPAATCASIRPIYHKRIAPSTYQNVAERPLRRDARENRERILVAARVAFAEIGIDVSVEEIAHRAGVGMGTLYRRFPTEGRADRRRLRAASRPARRDAPRRARRPRRLDGVSRLPHRRRQRSRRTTAASPRSSAPT